MPTGAPRFVRLYVAIAACVLLTAVTATARAELGTNEPTKMRVYIGTYTSGDSKGIYRFDLDLKTGQPSEPELAAKPVNPSFLAIRPNGKSLYCLTETIKSGTKVGAVDSVAI